MPVGGIVITVYPDNRQEVEITLGRFSNLSVYGSDEKGNIISVVKGNDSASIEKIIKEIEGIDSVLGVNLAYLKEDDAPDVLAQNI